MLSHKIIIWLLIIETEHPCPVHKASHSVISVFGKTLGSLLNGAHPVRVGFGVELVSIANYLFFYGLG